MAQAETARGGPGARRGAGSHLRRAVAAADRETRERLLSCVHTRERFQDDDPEATELSERDARLVVANAEGYPFWRGYEIYLHLDPAVRHVSAAAGHGELARLQALLRASPHAANPRWAPGFTPERLPLRRRWRASARSSTCASPPASASWTTSSALSSPTAA